MHFRWHLYAGLVAALVLFGCRLTEPGEDRGGTAVVEATGVVGATAEMPAATEEVGPGPAATGGAQQAAATEGTGETGATAEADEAAAGATEAAAPTAAGKPPQSQLAEIRPPEMRSELALLSNLIGFRVTGLDGAEMGVVADFILNTCETYIVYFLVEPAGSLQSAPGSRIVFPYEAVTINSGALDAQAREIQLSLAPGQVAGAPGLPAGQPLLPVDWEAEVRDYWSQTIRLSNLSSECRVAAPESESGGGTVVIHKIAYATELLGAGLEDGLRNPLGRVEEAALEPESGKVSFFAVRLEGEGGLVLAPLRVVNIPNWALEPGSEVTLVLLTESRVLLEAPRIETAEDAARGQVQGEAYTYWGR